MKKCPVCESELESWSDHLDGHTLLESLDRCPKRHYFHEYMYGHTWTQVGSHRFLGHYTDTLEDVREREEAVNQAVEDLKKKLKNRKLVLSALAALVIPGGLVIVPLYHYLKSRKKQGQ